MTVLSQVLALPSDTANDGQTRLSVPKHSQTSQEARKTRFDWSQVSSWGDMTVLSQVLVLLSDTCKHTLRYRIIVRPVMLANSL